MQDFRIPKGLALFVGLLFQIVVGTIAFMMLYGAAVLIAMLIHTLEASGHAPAWLSVAGTWVEKVIFAVDCVLFGLFLLSEVIKYVRAVLEDLKKQ